MYLYGLLMKKWLKRKQKLVLDYAKSLTEMDAALLSEFFIPAGDGYSDGVDWSLFRQISVQ
jgi:hypothetical protein